MDCVDTETPYPSNLKNLPEPVSHLEDYFPRKEQPRDENYVKKMPKDEISMRVQNGENCYNIVFEADESLNHANNRHSDIRALLRRKANLTNTNK